MTKDELMAAVEEAQRKAGAAARKKIRVPAGMISTGGHVERIVDDTRLAMIEGLLMSILARESMYEGDHETKTMLELRDYWEAVVMAIEGTG